jgi:quercetin dioxygenase-like cupin family protein
MSYSPSPRPTYSGPTHIKRGDVALHLWGDERSGQVADWIYVSNEKIHQIVFGLDKGGAFTHSPDFRTIFAADEVLYVLEGELTLANPQTGEVVRADAGEAIFFRRDTWHHGFNHGEKPLRVLELFAPPPAQGTSGAYARTKPDLEAISYSRDDLLENWPMGRAAAIASASMHVLRPADRLWRLSGQERLTPVGIIASTEHLTVGTIDLHPGQHTDAEDHAGDESLYVVEGCLNISTPGNDGQRWFELQAGDGFFLPEGTSHSYYNISATTAKVVFGVAPSYLPRQ